MTSRCDSLSTPRRAAGTTSWTSTTDRRGGWRGKPDVYHAYQALLLARLPLAPPLSVQLAQHGQVR